MGFPIHKKETGSLSTHVNLGSSLTMNKGAAKEGTGRGFWLVALGAALWGIDPLFRIILLKTFTSAQIVLLEHIVVALCVAPILWKHRDELRGIRARHVGALLFISWGGSALATVLFTMGLSDGNFNAVLLLQKLQPLFVIIMARMVLKETLPQHFGPLFAIAIAGTYLLTFGFAIPFGHWNEFIQKGSLYSLGAAALWGGSTVMGRLTLDKFKYETVTSLRFLLALPLLMALAWSEGAAWSLPGGLGANAAVTVNLLAQALLPGLFSLLVYYKGLTTTKASAATLAELSFPMVAVIINWIAFEQLVTIPQIIGFLLIWMALFFISKQKDASVLSASL